MRTLIKIGVYALILTVPVATVAKVFFSKKTALVEAFPTATQVDSVPIELSSEERKSLQTLAGSAWQAKPLVFVGRKDGEVLGYAFIDTHKVRSLNETVMVVIGPDGATQKVVLLAFHEPAQYSAPQTWLEQFKGRELDETLSLRKGIDGLSGATYTARSVTAAVRRALVLHKKQKN